MMGEGANGDSRVRGSKGNEWNQGSVLRGHKANSGHLEATQ